MSLRQYIPDLPWLQLPSDDDPTLPELPDHVPELPEPDGDELGLCLPAEWFQMPTGDGTTRRRSRNKFIFKLPRCNCKNKCCNNLCDVQDELRNLQYEMHNGKITQ